MAQKSDYWNTPAGRVLAWLMLEKPINAEQAARLGCADLDATIELLQADGHVFHKRNGEVWWLRKGAVRVGQ